MNNNWRRKLQYQAWIVFSSHGFISCSTSPWKIGHMRKLTEFIQYLVPFKMCLPPQFTIMSCCNPFTTSNSAASKRWTPPRWLEIEVFGTSRYHYSPRPYELQPKIWQQKHLAVLSNWEPKKNDAAIWNWKNQCHDSTDIHPQHSI